ncbi:glycosyltransferase family 39 protein [Bacteroides thetaiotaomicron]|uniref:glycosyltransferase family 39 protein n=1 Tax=Bacteroides thetaiotaomicron TaxID=818 RepID=UPI0039C3EC60
MCTYYSFHAFFFLQTLLRDSLQVSLLLILNYFFVRYLFKDSRFSLLIVGVLLGIAILTLKALAVIGLGIIVFMFVVHRKSFKVFFCGCNLGYCRFLSDNNSLDDKSL